MRSSRRPPSPDPCLVHSRRTRFHGGTLIAIDVHELADHEARLRRDGYRPPSCPRCGGERLHVHDHLQRLLADELRVVRIAIVRYICAGSDCRATWRVLPAFVARHLWRRWTTVARAVACDPRTPRRAGVPARTYRRWRARLDSAARQLVHILAHHDDEDVAKFASVAGFDASRRELIELFTAGRVLGAHALEDIASTLHLLERGVRLL